MTYQFEVDKAKKYGVEEAIILYSLIFWIRKNKANRQAKHDGHYWTYNSVSAWQEQFPFWSTGQIRRILESLVKQGVILTGNYNKSAYDRTLWYAVVDESILEIEENHLPEPENGEAETDEPIPLELPVLDTDEEEKVSTPSVRRLRKDPKKLVFYDYDERVWKGITQSDLDFWQDDFDGVDVVSEIKHMKGWLDCHPKKKDFKRFIVNWLGRAQGRSTVFAGGNGNGSRRYAR